MATTTKVYKSGTSLCSLLTVLFVALKLCDKIDWSWWWVLSPLWAPWALVFAIMGIFVAIKVVQRAKQ